MAYIGKTPVIGNFQVCDAISVVDAQAAYTMQVGGVNVSPESANHMLVSLNGILQAPTSSFTVSGSTITFASALETGDVIDFIQILGNVLDLGVPSDNTVSLAKLTATGTKDATTFLRGDNTFAGGGKVLQVVQTVKTDIFTRSSSASFADITDVSVSITPSSTSSKILLTFDADVGSSRTDDSPTFVYFKLTKAVGGGSASDVTGALGDSRGSSIRAWCNAGSRFGGASDITAEHTHAQYLDSPSTTSALVYQVQVRSTDGTATIGGSESTSDSNTTPITVANIQAQIPTVEAEIEQEKQDAINKKASGKQNF
jgi:hypothetical protein